MRARGAPLSRDLTAALVEACDRDPHESVIGVAGAVAGVARRPPDQVRTRLEVLGRELLRWPEKYGVESAQSGLTFHGRAGGAGEVRGTAVVSRLLCQSPAGPTAPPRGCPGKRPGQSARPPGQCQRCNP